MVYLRYQSTCIIFTIESIIGILDFTVFLKKIIFLLFLDCFDILILKKINLFSSKKYFNK